MTGDARKNTVHVSNRGGFSRNVTTDVCEVPVGRNKQGRVLGQGSQCNTRFYQQFGRWQCLDVHNNADLLQVDALTRKIRTCRAGMQNPCQIWQQSGCTCTCADLSPQKTILISRNTNHVVFKRTKVFTMDL